MNNMFDRSEMLIGKDNLNFLRTKTVAVIGIGGVGGTAVECLVRSGIKKVIIVDFDDVDISNLNRQILFKSADVGHNKIEMATKHLLEINPQLELTALNIKVQDDLDSIFSKINVDMMIDAIDDINSKVNIVQYCLTRSIPFICSLGMANRLDPSQVTIVRLDKTYNCPLAKKFRRLLREKDIDLKRVNCIFSHEIPIVRAETPSSMMMVPSSAGLNAAAYVIKYFIKGRDYNGITRD